MNYSLSDSDLYNLFKGKVKILTYKDLYLYTNIDDLLDPFGVVILLYELRPYVGHWTIIFKRNKKVIEFFDSYGLMLDSELDWVDKKYKEDLKENYKYLSVLVYNSPYQLEYNDHQFQEYNDNISTCGRFAYLRYKYKKLNIDYFWRLINETSEELGISKDKISVILT